MDLFKTKKVEMAQINEELRQLTDFERADNAYEFVPQQYTNRQKNLADQSVQKAIHDNELIGYALQNSKLFKLDDLSKSKLKSIRARNLSQMLLNSRRYKKDSDKMVRVKTAVKAVEDKIVAPLGWEAIEEAARNSGDKLAKADVPFNKAKTLEECLLLYQDAVVACQAYLDDKDKTHKSPKGAERYQLVKQTKLNMLDEMAKLNFAKQMVFRQKMGDGATCAKDLIVAAQGVINESPTYTQQELEEHKKKPANKKTYDSFEFTIPMMEERAITGELRFIFDALNQNVPANMLVNNYGTDKNKKKYAIKLLRDVRKMLASFRNNGKASYSILAGEYVVNLFQAEGGNLEFSYNYRGNDGKLVSRKKSLGISARDLGFKLGLNMIENEDVFGTSNTKEIMLKTDLVNDETSDEDKVRFVETAKTYLRIRLGIENIALTNIPGKEIVRFAKLMESGQNTKAQTLNLINNYEYGDKEAKRQEREQKKQNMRQTARTLNQRARAEGFKSIKEMEAHYAKIEEQKERLQELTKEENKRARQEAEEAQENGQAQEAEHAQNQQNAQPVEQAQNQQAQPAEQANVQAQADVQAQPVEQPAEQVQNAQQQVGQAQENQQEQNQQNAQIQLPQEAIDYERALEINEQAIRQEADAKKNSVMRDYYGKLLEYDTKQRVLQDRLNKLMKQAEKEKNDQENRLQERTDYATKYMEEHAAKVDALKKEYELKVKQAEEYIKSKEEWEDKEERLKEEKDILMEELGSKIHDLTINTSKHLEDWNEKQDLILARRTARIDKKCLETSNKLEALKLQFNEEKLQYENKCESIDSEMNSKLAVYNDERRKFNSWKESYRNEQERAANNPAADFQIVEANGIIHGYDNPKNFWEWKADLEKDVKKRAQEQENAEAERKRHKEIVESYRELSADFDELVSNDLETTTDVRVNGEDTMELLRNLQKAKEDKSFDKLIVDANEHQKKQYNADLQGAYKKRSEAYVNRSNSENELKDRQAERRKVEVDLAINKNKQDELEKEIAKVTAPVINERKQIPKEKEDAAQALFEKINAKVHELQQTALNSMSEEVIKINQELEEKKAAEEEKLLNLDNALQVAQDMILGNAIEDNAKADKKLKKQIENRKKKEELQQKRKKAAEDAAEKRKQKLTEDCQKTIDLGESIVNAVVDLLVDADEQTIDEKIAITQEFEKSLAEAENRVNSEDYDPKQAKEAINSLWVNFGLKLNEVNNKVEKNRSEEESKKKKELDDKLGELEARRLALEDEKAELDEKKVRLDAGIKSLEKTVDSWDSDLEACEANVQKFKRKISYYENLENEEKAEKEANKPDWNYDEQKLLDIIAEVIYANDTWKMDNETFRGSRLFNVMIEYGDVIGKWLGDIPRTQKLLKEFAKKLPLSMLGIDEEFITNDVFNWLQEGRNIAIEQLQGVREEARERENQRQLKRNAKIALRDQERQRIDKNRELDKQITADQQEEEQDRKEELNDELLEQQESQELSLDYNAEHKLDAMSELVEVFDKEAAKELLEMKKQKAQMEARVKSIFSWFSGNNSDEEEEKKKKEEEWKKEEAGIEEEYTRRKEEKLSPELRKKMEAYEEAHKNREMRRLAREERKKARDARKAERDKEDALFEAKWAKEIEDAGTDDDSADDAILLNMTDDYLLTQGLKKALTNMDPQTLPQFQKMVDMEKDLEKKLHKYLRSTQKILSKEINKRLGEAAQPEPIEQVPYYKENGITDEERQRRIDLGREQLNKMISNAVKSEDGEGQFVRNVLSTYLAKSSILDIRSMLASAIRNARPIHISEDASEEEQSKAFAPLLGGLFKGAGPLMHKILQGMPASLIPKGMEDAFDDFKNNLSPIPKDIVDAQLLSIVQRSNGRITKIEKVKSLGAASVGQAFLCRVFTNTSSTFGEEVVIKLLRPDVRNRMLREEKIMKECAAKVGRGMAKTYDGLLTRYKEELDLTIEAGNCERGRIYDMQDAIVSMKVSNLASPTPNAFMAKRADGDTIVDVLKKSRKNRESVMKRFYEKDEDGNIVMENDKPKITVPKGADVETDITFLSRKLFVLRKQQKMLCDLSEKWVDEAVFGEGFYHGDLHAGNMIMSDRRLTVIDFGNATKLDAFQQKQITIMLIAAAAGSGSGFMDGFTALLSDESRALLENKETKEQLQAVFSEVMKLGDYYSSAERIAAALVRAQKLGFELPPAIYGFQQCQIRLMNTLDSFNAEVAEVQNALNALKTAQNSTVIDTKKSYQNLYRDDTDSAMYMKMALLPDKEEDLRVILKKVENERPLAKAEIEAKDENEKAYKEIYNKNIEYDGLEGEKAKWTHSALFNYFNPVFGNIFEFTHDSLLTLGSGFASGTNANYSVIGSNLFDESELTEVLKKHGLDPTDTAKYKKQFSELRKEQKVAIGKDMRALLSKYDVPGAILDLEKAVDAGEGEDVIKELEDEVIRRIQFTKAVFIERARSNINAKVEKEANDQYEDDDEATEEVINQFKEDKTAEYQKYLNADSILAPIREKLKNPDNLPQAELELAPLFKDPYYGKALEDAYNAYKNAPAEGADAQANKERLLNEFLDAYKVPLMLMMGDTVSVKPFYAIDQSKPMDFVGVMGDVIEDQYKEALKRISLGKSIKYGFRIKGDVEKRNLTSWEFIKLSYNRVRGNDI